MTAVEKHIQPATWYPSSRVSGDGSASRDLFTVTVVVTADVTARPMAVDICRAVSANGYVGEFPWWKGGGTYTGDSREEPPSQSLALCVHGRDGEQVTDDEDRIGCRHEDQNDEGVAPIGNSWVNGREQGP